ncbi:MAG TPA: hypothetical protein VMU62_01485, partial [Acidobacteriaceae bacterium]|nr:hypothetical protein [Acidobacteriaceae bacterium]
MFPCLLGLLALHPLFAAPAPRGPNAATAQRASQPAVSQSFATQSDATQQTTLPSAPSTSAPQLTFLPHPDNTRFWISGQENTIYQMHENFHSPYQGVNSFTAPFQYKASEVATLMLGYQLRATPRYETDLLYDE